MQNYANHRRWFPLYHFVTFPIFTVNLVIATVVAIRQPGLSTAWGVVLALGFILIMGTARLQSVRVQDRIIWLEERLRLARLAPELVEASAVLTPRQFVAMRFASDAEYPALVRRVLANEFPDRGSIKRSVVAWREDRFRV